MCSRRMLKCNSLITSESIQIVLFRSPFDTDKSVNDVYNERLTVSGNQLNFSYNVLAERLQTNTF